MREVSAGGQSVVTTNAIARQLFLYASQLAQAGRIDVVDFPALVDGATTNCTLLIGAHLSLGAVTIPRTEAGSLAGEDSALFEFQRRSDDLRALRHGSSDREAQARGAAADAGRGGA